jgi:hypothetical protein
MCDTWENEGGSMAEWNTYHIVRSESYDWIGIYRGRQLLFEGHSITPEDLLKLLELDYTHEVWDGAKFDEYGGRCPSVKLDDLTIS